MALGDSRADEHRRDTRSRPNIKLPDGYDNEADFLSEMRQLFFDDVQFDRLNREAALEDLRFMVGDQWDDIVRQRREAARKPVLTINRLPAFVAQIVGARRLSETTLKIVPDNGGTRSVARVREGLVRNIQKVSRANVAYDNALAGAVMCGIGNFQLTLDYENDDVFEQSMGVTAVPDHLSVVWDRQLSEATGRDAGHCFVVDTMSKKDFYSFWPWATPADVVIDVTLRGDLRMNGWIAVDDVRVVSYWRMRTRKRTLALMTDGSTQDITDRLASDDEQEKLDVLGQVMQRTDGSPIMRVVNRKYAQMYVCSGIDVLEGPYELPISRIPVFRVPGWEVNVGEWRHRWGLIRFLKDPQRLHNYWRSVAAEKIMQTPRAVWLAADSAVAGREKDYRNSHLSDNPLLIWSAESGQKPERLMPAQVEESLLSQAEITSQDLKDVSNIHEANLGMPSNEVSGAAIVARQRVSDTGTVIYHDNLNEAIEQCGQTMNELIPFVYDTPRIVKILGDDAKADMQVINMADHPESIDITVGKYSVSTITGPSTATRRIEAAENMMALANAMPNVLAVSADLIVEAQDWPGAQQIADRIRLSMPPELLKPDEITPQIAAKAAAQQQQGQQAQHAQVMAAIADFLKTQSEATLNNARARNFQAAADAIGPRLQNESINTASQAADRELRGQLEAIKTANVGG
jgi:hypothetical protein